METKTKQKGDITKVNFIIMLVTAIFFDITLSLIQLIPFAGSVAASVFNVLPLMIFYLWYRIQGVSFANPKRAISFFGASVIEFIPLLNILPTWTAEIIYMYTLQNSDKILSVVAGATKVASATAVGGKMSSFLPQAGMASRALGEVSHQASRVAQQAEMVGHLRKNNFVGNEIRPKTEKFSKKAENIAQFPNTRKEPQNVTPFSNAKKDEPHNEEWIYPKKAA